MLKYIDKLEVNLTESLPRPNPWEASNAVSIQMAAGKWWRYGRPRWWSTGSAWFPENRLQALPVWRQPGQDWTGTGVERWSVSRLVDCFMVFVPCV